MAMPDQPHAITSFLRGLRSVRRFDPDRPLPDDVLADILETGRWTGSAKNAQPWRLVLLRDRELLRSISELGLFAAHIAGATIAIALVMEGRSRSRAFDEGRLAENLQLAAWAHGVGSCIATIFPDENEARLLELIGAPEPWSARTVLSFGYPADPEALRVDEELRARIPLGRIPLDELVGDGRFPGVA